MRAATAGTVAPSHPLLAFDKLTIKLEMLCQFRKNEIQPSAAYGKAVPSRLSHLRSVSLRQSLKCFVKELKARAFNTLAGRRASAAGAEGTAGDGGSVGGAW